MANGEFQDAPPVLEELSTLNSQLSTPILPFPTDYKTLLLAWQ